MITLGSWQAELAGVVVGADTIYRMFTFDAGKPDVAVHDAALPREDGIRFGKDFLAGSVVTLELGIDTTDDRAAVKALATLRGVWQGDDVRLTPGAVTTLRYQLANGQTRRVYGRPRKFAPGGLATAASGYIPVTCDFQCVDHRFYADADTQATYTLTNAPSSGFTSPITAPITSSTVTSVPGTITVGGSTPSWLVATVTAGNADLVTPQIEVVGLWTATLEVVLKPGESIVIDPRPWVRTVTRNDVANAAGVFSASSPRLSQWLVPPGTREIVLRGTDTSGTASLSLSVHDAYTSY